MNIHFSGIVAEIFAGGKLLESLEDDPFGSEMLPVEPTINTNTGLLKVEDTTLTKMETKPVVLKKRIRSKLKSKPFTRV